MRSMLVGAALMVAGVGPTSAGGIIIMCSGNPIYGLTYQAACDEYGKYVASGKSLKYVDGVDCLPGSESIEIFRKKQQGFVIFDEIGNPPADPFKAKDKLCQDLVDTMDVCEDGGCKE